MEVVLPIVDVELGQAGLDVVGQVFIVPGQEGIPDEGITDVQGIGCPVVIVELMQVVGPGQEEILILAVAGQGEQVDRRCEGRLLLLRHGPVGIARYDGAVVTVGLEGGRLEGGCAQCPAGFRP